MPTESDDDPPLSLATFDQITDELQKRSIGCVVACLIKMNDHEEHTYANWRGRTVALGLCDRIRHEILHQPPLRTDDES